MQSQSHAFVKPHASTSRLRSLVNELEIHGCTLPLTQTEARIDFDLAECEARWLAAGGIEELFDRYADVAVHCPDLHGRLPA